MSSAVVHVRNWSDITEDFLNREYERIRKDPAISWTKAYYPYWLDQLLTLSTAATPAGPSFITPSSSKVHMLNGGLDPADRMYKRRWESRKLQRLIDINNSSQSVSWPFDF